MFKESLFYVYEPEQTSQTCQEVHIRLCVENSILYISKTRVMDMAAKQDILPRRNVITAETFRNDGVANHQRNVMGDIDTPSESIRRHSLSPSPRFLKMPT